MEKSRHFVSELGEYKLQNFLCLCGVVLLLSLTTLQFLKVLFVKYIRFLIT